ncbi:protein D2 [Scaptodrosophila lebanonensis]|uniref:Protein D2 n=1 Tax=Drosophila lebanonensis TaxID=7225 RepID=A0A6J2T2G3_DROLE|nr:protein D2 [Scaptodrosophila lebanonensis]
MSYTEYSMNDIVPDVVDVVPPGKLMAIYAEDITVKPGNKLTPTQVKDPPHISWIEDDDGTSLHTLLMVDPDAPSPEDPKFREVLHWFVINIPGQLVEDGQIVAEYVGAGPPKETGLHRYVFLVFKQSREIKEELYIDKFTGSGRLNFNTRVYANQYDLGFPIAGNYFLAQYDDYVPIRNAQFVG